MLSFDSFLQYGMSLTCQAMLELDIIPTIPDCKLVTFQQVLKKGAINGVPQYTQEDTIAAIYNIMNGR